MLMWDYFITIQIKKVYKWASFVFPFTRLPGVFLTFTSPDASGHQPEQQGNGVLHRKSEGGKHWFCLSHS